MLIFLFVQPSREEPMTKAKQIFLFTIIGIAWAGAIVGWAEVHAARTWVHPEERGPK